jgi:hypothetical protein
LISRGVWGKGLRDGPRRGENGAAMRVLTAFG